MPAFAHRVLTLFGSQRFIALQKFFRLNRVIRKRFGRGVDGSKTTANDDHRQAHLHVGNRIGFGGTGELQGHEKVRCRPHATRETVGNIEHRWLARAHRQRNVIEAHLERIIGAQRATEAHATEQRKFIAAFEKQTDHLEEIFVPAHRDAVFSHAAEAGHDAIIERFIKRVDILDRLETGLCVSIRRADA